MRISDWSSDVCSSDLPVAISRAAKEKVKLFTPHMNAPPPTAHARFEGQRRKWHSLSIPPSFSAGCQTFNRLFLTKASTLPFIDGLCRFPGSSIFPSYGLDDGCRLRS